MKKIFNLLMVLLLILLVGCSDNVTNTKTQPSEETPSISLQMEDVMINYIDSLMSSTNGYIPSWNKEGFKGRWNYIDGVFLSSIVNLYEQTNEEKYKDFLIKYINYYIDKDGNFINPKTNESGYKSGELDSVCASRILFDAYEYTKDSRYKIAIDNTYNELINMPKASGSNNFWHKTNYPNQIWLDGMYMYAPFYARYAKQKNIDSIFIEIKEQYEYIRNNMYDETTGLYFHGHDTTKMIFWADKDTGNSKSFWLRSMGWFLVSLVEVYEYFPDGEEKEYIKELFIEGIEGILKYIDKTNNMFYQIVNLGKEKVKVKASYLEGLKNTKYLAAGKYVDTEISNYLESSGSSMISYCLLKGSRLGILDKVSTGKDIFDAIYSYSFKNNQLNNICITAGLGPENKTIRDGSHAYYLAEPVGSNDAKGVGPFIMAFIEYIR